MQQPTQLLSLLVTPLANAQNNAANAAGAQQQSAANAGQNMGAQSPPVQANHPQSSQRQHVQDELEIA
jgi:hypothetical protein